MADIESTSADFHDIRLTDGVITLRPFRTDDAPAHLNGQDDEQRKWLDEGNISTLESVQRWIAKNEEAWRTGAPTYNFAIEDLKESVLAGMIEANTIVPGLEEGEVNIAYALYPEFRGKGYVGRAVSIIIDFLRAKGYARAIIRANMENEPSVNVAKRCGFMPIGEVINIGGEPLTVFAKDLVYKK